MPGWSCGWSEPHSHLHSDSRLYTAGECDGSSQWSPMSFHLIQILIGPLPCTSHAHSSGHCRKRRHKDMAPILREPTLFGDNDRDNGHRPYCHSGHNHCVYPALLCAKPHTKCAAHVSLSSC